jgi:serine/threonine protein kinase/dipeptidyl aminopeptidase/acylaminoacyl peptidase
MGRVYLAEDTKLKRKVSLKFLSQHFSEDRQRVHRFEQEARAISALNHPNILTIHEVGEVDGGQFIAAEFIDGETLRKRLAAGLKLDDAIGISTQVAAALVAAHRVNIVHRDIKPENIMIRYDDGLVKVLDFGLAKVSAERRVESGAIDKQADTKLRANTTPGLVMGTVAYMSPEQARGDLVDERTDIWSLGVVLYEMIAGSSPFVAGTSSEIISGILSRSAAPPLVRYSHLVPERLEEIVEKALTKNRDERYQTSKDLLIDLKRLKQSLELKAGIERGAAPDNVRRSSPGRLLSDSQTSPPAAATESIHPNSSAEYIATEIKRHKLLVFGFLTLFIISGVGFAAYKYSVSTGPSQSRFTSPQKLNFLKLTTSGNVRDVTISPDGRYAAYSVNENGKNSLRLRQTATNSDVEILAPVESVLTNLSFTRDGNYLYYVYGGFEGTLFQIPALGGSPRRIAVKVSGGAAVSPDGNTIAYTHYDGETIYTLSLANLDGSNERTLLTTAPPSWFAGSLIPAWSPDGKTIAIGINFTENNKQLLKLFGVSVSDGSRRELSDRNWNDIFGVEWLSDGHLIVSGSEYSDSQTLPNQLWLIAAPNVEPQRITNDLSDYYGVRATANGDTLMTLQLQTVANLWITPNNDAARSEQITPASGVSAIRWTPDGKFIFISNKNIWTMNADGSGKRQLTNNQAENFLPSMTPDGRYIVYMSVRNNISHIWRIDADGSNPKQLTFGFQQWSPNISPDAKWVFYVDATEKEYSTLWKVPIDGGAPVQVSTTKAFESYVSPRNGRIVFELPDTSEEQLRLGLISPSGGEPVKTFTIPGTSGDSTIRWTPDGRAIAFTNLRDNGANIWTIAVDDDGEAKPLTNFKTESIFDFAWSADGKQLAAIRGTAIRDAVLINETK